MVPSAYQQNKDLLQQPWLDDLRSCLIGFSNGKDSTRVPNEYVGWN